MTDILDKVLDTAKKLRKYAKKSGDPAFVNLITDLNLELADLRVQLAEARNAAPADHDGTPAAQPTHRAPATTGSSRAEKMAMAPTTQVRSGGDIDSTLNDVFGDDTHKPQA